MEGYQEIDRAAINRKEMLTFPECCVYTGFSPSCLYKKTMRKEIPHFKPTGKQVFFKRSEIDEWLQRNRIVTNAEIEQAATSYVVNGRR